VEVWREDVVGGTVADGAVGWCSGGLACGGCIWSDALCLDLEVGVREGCVRQPEAELEDWCLA